MYRIRADTCRESTDTDVKSNLAGIPVSIRLGPPIFRYEPAGTGRTGRYLEPCMGEKIEVEEALPQGFIDRVGERGLVVEGWVPQARILAHSSTGGLVSHCGWNSILESLKFGVPIVAMLMHLEQPFNAKLVEGVGVAAEFNRDINGRLNKEEIAQAIRKVVVEKSGEDVRIKARNFGEKTRMKGDEEIDEAVEVLLQLCKDWK
ncbi:unnamed protein product [Camellia sinensis]